VCFPQKANSPKFLISLSKTSPNENEPNLSFVVLPSFVEDVDAQPGADCTPFIGVENESTHFRHSPVEITISAPGHANSSQPDLNRARTLSKSKFLNNLIHLFDESAIEP
jgi:hypothetical protein